MRYVKKWRILDKVRKEEERKICKRIDMYREKKNEEVGKQRDKWEVMEVRRREEKCVRKDR